MLREEPIEALRVGQKAVLARATHKPRQGDDKENEADEPGKGKDGARECFVLFSESRKRGLGGYVVLVIVRLATHL